MNDYFIEDWRFNLMTEDFGATQTDINNFMNELAHEYGAKWAPESDGYRLTGISEDAYIDLEDSLDDRISEMPIA